MSVSRLSSRNIAKEKKKETYLVDLEYTEDRRDRPIVRKTIPHTVISPSPPPPPPPEKKKGSTLRDSLVEILDMVGPINLAIHMTLKFTEPRAHC